MAEGKGFVGHVSNNRALLQHTRVQNAAEHGTPRNPKGLGISEILIAPRAPWQNPFAERVIGSIRRECLDHVIVINERHLRRLLRRYLAYYKATRPQSLHNDSPHPPEIPTPAGGRNVAIP